LQLFFDITLGAEKSFPIAEKLDGLNAPLTFVTAYARMEMPPKFHKYDLQPKPVHATLFRK